MANNVKNVAHGSVGGTTIYVDLTRIDHGAAAVKVMLSASYVRARQPGTPAAPGFTGAAAASLDFPRTHPSGTVPALVSAEDARICAPRQVSRDRVPRAGRSRWSQGK
jgi:hypothetical protein